MFKICKDILVLFVKLPMFSFLFYMLLIMESKEKIYIDILVETLNKISLNQLKEKLTFPVEIVNETC